MHKDSPLVDYLNQQIQAANIDIAEKQHRMQLLKAAEYGLGIRLRAIQGLPIASNPTLALEKLLATRRGITSGSIPIPGRSAAGTDTVWLYSALVDTLNTAEPFYVSADLCLMIEAAAEALPSFELARQDIPVPSGWAYLAVPLIIDNYFEFETYSKLELQATFHAMQWTDILDEKSGGHFLRMVFYTVLGDQLLPTAFDIWNYNQDWSDDQHSGVVSFPELTQLRKFFGAFLRIVNEKIVKQASTRPSRSLRRAEERKGSEEPPNIRIVELRRIEYVRRDDPEDGNWYTHRFVVRGHWRHQWYPSEGIHKWKWIGAFVKGPEGTPITEATRLFVVDR